MTAVSTFMLVCNFPARVEAQSGAVAPAQPSAAPATPPILGVNDPANPFHLTATQQKEYIAIKLKFQSDANAIMQTTAIPGAQKEARIHGLQVASAAKLKEILNPTQLAVLNVLTARQKKLVVLQAQAQALLAQLDKTVTPAQKAKLEEFKTSAQSQASAIQLSGSSNSVKSDQLNLLQSKFQAEIATIFNKPEQISIINQLKAVQKQTVVAEQQLQATFH
jgi:hypothetical protein